MAAIADVTSVGIPIVEAVWGSSCFFEAVSETTFFPGLASVAAKLEEEAVTLLFGISLVLHLCSVLYNKCVC